MPAPAATRSRILRPAQPAVLTVAINPVEAFDQHVRGSRMRLIQRQFSF